MSKTAQMVQSQTTYSNDVGSILNLGDYVPCDKNGSHICFKERASTGYDTQKHGQYDWNSVNAFNQNFLSSTIIRFSIKVFSSSSWFGCDFTAH